MRKIIIITLILISSKSQAQSDSTKKIPFEGMDLSWINGQSRIKNSPLEFRDKSSELVLTGTAYVDAYYNYNFANPIDNTQTISSTIGRHNEIQLNLSCIGLESNYKNVIGRISIQAGAMQHIVQELDPSVNRGRNTGTGNLKFIREAAAGYHFNKWYGINLEAGIFMSYVGLESYLLQDNWSYQRSMVSEVTPFYFQGARLQMYPTKKLKQEIWLLNGWQSYNSFSRGPALGSSTFYRPYENLQLVANFYVGRDTYNPDTLGNQSNRLRFHHDNSIVARYYKNPNAEGVSQMAISINNHFGFQNGIDDNDSVTVKEHFVYGTSIANRIWFNKNKMAVTLRVDYLANGGAYLAFSPAATSNNAFSDAYTAKPYKKLEILQGFVTFDLMPNDFVTFRFEYGYRRANLPYFTGSKGTTSSSGWVNGPNSVIPFRPDLKNTENRVTVAVNFRL